MAKTPTKRAGWYQDEGSPGHLRWWDGTEWTANVKRVPDFFTTDVRNRHRPAAPSGRERRPG